MMKTRLERSFLLVGAFAMLAACSGASEGAPLLTPYSSAPGATGILGDGSARVYSTPAGDACIQVGTECVKPQSSCAAGDRADVIVNSSGKVVDTVCYQTTSDVPLLESASSVDLHKENKAIVRLDGIADGADIAGDLSSSGNKVTVFGQGPSVSTIAGNVTASGNNFALRGVTVQKNTTIDGNNGTLVLCVLEGDVTITGNNTVIAECTIFGKLHIQGQNTKLVNVKVAGGVVVDGSNTVCDGVTSFTDGNANKTVESSELGATVVCSSSK